MSDAPEACEVVPNCPVCGSELFVSASITKLKICVCKICGASLTIPDDAWLRAKMLRDKQSKGT